MKAIPDNKRGRDGYFCSLVESKREKGKPVHKLIFSFGYIEKERLPYLRAAFNDGDPSEILQNELAKRRGKEK